MSCNFEQRVLSFIKAWNKKLHICIKIWERTALSCALKELGLHACVRKQTCS